MSKLKWFDGGHDRGQDAKNYIMILQKNLNNTTELPLKNILKTYLLELENQSMPIPVILSRFNLDVSSCLINNSISLSDENKEILKNITSISNIRYGY